MINLPDRYLDVIQYLTGGGMSDTFICKDKNLSRRVVIKSLKHGIEKYRLIDELTALANIRSQYVVQVLDVIKDGDDVVGFVEEYIDGTDLKPLRSGVSEIDILKFLYPIAAGICDIHNSGRLHRDLKPDNMKLDIEGVLKIFDFGLAKMANGAKTKQFFYTQGYTAPEAFQQDAFGVHHFTEAVDVYAFGMIALWALSDGVLPSALCEVPPKTVKVPKNFQQSHVALGADLVQLLDSTLSSDPSLRPSMFEVKEQLGARLLRDRHRMLITHQGTTYVVEASNRTVKLSAGQDVVTIYYDGVKFFVTSVTGHVRHNNQQMSNGYVLEGSSVIVLGDPSAGYRTSITADISHPEVTL
ncbi:protein kinase [Fulvimarina sp. MAC8]|uniref:serine/threonine protein kinase n=1 Tax=Fulvimarina sp. MAC8 TaxID=3162874 RepID=UPI0032F025E2